MTSFPPAEDLDDTLAVSKMLVVLTWQPTREEQRGDQE